MYCLRLTDKVAIITGGASGIGLATAKLFLQNGATVVIFDLIRNDSVAELEKEFQDKIAFFEVDVTNEEAVKKNVNQVFEQYGKIDVLFNNAGISGIGKIHELSQDYWNKVMNVNVNGVFLMSKYVVQKMLNRGGSIINMSSCVAEIGLEDRVLYAGTKGAVLAMTKSMQVDYASHNIRVNALLPGTIYTPFVEKYLSSAENPEETLNGIKKRQLSDELGKPIDVAQAALYLASDESKFLMGSPLYIDGGAVFGKKI